VLSTDKASAPTTQRRWWLTITNWPHANLSLSLLSKCCSPRVLKCSIRSLLESQNTDLSMTSTDAIPWIGRLPQENSKPELTPCEAAGTVDFNGQIVELCTSYKAIKRTQFMRLWRSYSSVMTIFPDLLFIRLLRDLVRYTAQPIASKLCNISSNCKGRDHHCKPEIYSI